MRDIQRKGDAHWSGDLKSGTGKTSLGSGAGRDLPYSVPSRFEDGKGTNPEEMIAAAHAACFSMMLAKILGDREKTAKDIHTTATLTMAQRAGGWKIIKVHLDTRVAAQDVDAATLNEAAGQAKDQCPISVLLRPGLEDVTLSASLAQ